MKQYRITSKDIHNLGNNTIPDALLPDDDPVWKMITNVKNPLIKQIEDSVNRKDNEDK